MFTDIGRSNLESLTNLGEIDSLLFSPNGALHSYLTKLAHFKTYVIPSNLLSMVKKLLAQN